MSNFEITVFLQESEQVYQIMVESTQNIETLKRSLEFETTILIKDQDLFFEGKILENSKTIKDYDIKAFDMVILIKKQLVQQQQRTQPQPQQQQQQQQQTQQQQPQNQRTQQRMFEEIFSNATTLINYYKNNLEELTNLINNNPPFAQAILNEDKEQLEQYIRMIKEQRRINALATTDPYGAEAQKLIYENIQKQNIEKNMEHAMEHTPEVFGRVIMLYINCTINGVPLKAFVDTGAQQSIMSEKCAEKCGLMRICDTRFHGIAKGVGTAKIVGRVHNANIGIGANFFNIALSILSQAGQDTEFILGLDMLKRHQCLINLGKGTLAIGTEEVDFLHEKDLKDLLGEKDELPENYLTPTTTTTNNNNSSTTTTTTSNTPTPTQPQPVIVNKPSANNIPQNRPTQPQPQPSTSQHSEEKILTLINIGCPREKAIQLLNRTKGDVEQAASIFFMS